MSFIEKLDKLMAEKRITKAVLSREADIPYTTIDGFYKKGCDNIKLSTLRKLAAYFNCSLDYLVDDETERNTPSTIAAHFEGEEFTEDELDEIRQFAEFVKNRKNK